MLLRSSRWTLGKACRSKIWFLKQTSVHVAWFWKVISTNQSHLERPESIQEYSSCMMGLNNIFHTRLSPHKQAMGHTRRLLLGKPSKCERNFSRNLAEVLPISNPLHWCNLSLQLTNNSFLILLSTGAATWHRSGLHTYGISNNTCNTRSGSMGWILVKGLWDCSLKCVWSMRIMGRQTQCSLQTFQ